jgi:putative Holliday junction resolvase
MDVGARRIGLAISDPLGITAQGLETLQRINKRTDFETLSKLISDYEIKEIVVGYPLRMSGMPSAQTAHVEAFAKDLERKYGLPVHRWDERLTSVQAGRVLRESNISIEKRARAVDRLAAVLILQSFLDHRAIQRER